MQEYKVKVNDCGTTFWYDSNEKLHRENGPAVEYLDGKKEWFYHGKCHRKDGPACVCPNGYKEWWLYGLRHRENGPAIEYVDGSWSWWMNGNRHREDGPAVLRSDNTYAWWINGIELSETEFLKQKKNVVACDHKIIEIDGVKYKLTPI